MHLLAREVRTLDDGDQAEDLGHAPADIVFLSFSDSDLLCLNAAHGAQAAPGASLRTASLSRLLHPMSIDLYVAGTIMESRCVVVRLLGGWNTGATGRRNWPAPAGRPGLRWPSSPVTGVTTPPCPAVHRGGRPARPA